MAERIIKTTEDRFKHKYKKNENGCWEWSAYVNNDGYGRFYYEEKIILAHRASWIMHKGKIPKEMCVCHKCDNPKCVNHEHLFLGTHRQNMQDSANKKRQNNSRKTHCSNGHEFSAENTRIYFHNGSTKRWCRACDKLIYAPVKNKKIREQKKRELT